MRNCVALSRRVGLVTFSRLRMTRWYDPLSDGIAKSHSAGWRPGWLPSLIAILKKVASGCSGRFFRAADDLSTRRYFGASVARARARVFFLPFPVRGDYASG
jgi:hypothetical protein